MESFPSGFPLGRTQQMPLGPGMYGSGPMSPTRAEAGCAGVPVPPSTPSTVSRQVPNAGDVSFSVGPTGGCAQQNNVDNTGSFMASGSNVAPGPSGQNPMMQNFGSRNPSFCGMNPNFQNCSGLNPRVFDPSGSAIGHGPQFMPGALIFFSPLPLLLASGTMGIVMAIAPLWVKRQKWMTQSSIKHCVSQW